MSRVTAVPADAYVHSRAAVSVTRKPVTNPASAHPHMSVPESPIGGTRRGDSRYPAAPKWAFGTDGRPPVGTSKTYLGAELARENDNKIGGLSPGPMYYPQRGEKGRSGFAGDEPPKYSFGEKRVNLDGPPKWNVGGPGPVTFKALGKQRFNSESASAPAFGMGSSTRDNMEKVDLSKYHVSNNSVQSVLGPIDYSRAADKLTLEREALAKEKAAAMEPSSRKSLARALAVAMSANPKFAEADPKLKVALLTLHSRVAQLADGGRPMTLQQR